MEKSWRRWRCWPEVVCPFDEVPCLWTDRYPRYNTIQYNAIQCNAIQYNAIQYNTDRPLPWILQYNAKIQTQYNTDMQRDTNTTIIQRYKHNTIQRYKNTNTNTTKLKDTKRYKHNTIQTYKKNKHNTTQRYKKVQTQYKNMKHIQCLCTDTYPLNKGKLYNIYNIHIQYNAKTIQIQRIRNKYNEVLLPPDRSLQKIDERPRSYS